MLFNSLRVLLWLTISFLIILRIRTAHINHKKLISIFSVFLCMILISASGMFPVENLFMSFKTPESVFEYASCGEINDIVYGDYSCMLVYSKGKNRVGQYIVPKTKGAYKIPSYFDTKKVFHKFDKSGNFDVYNLSGTSDYYIVGIMRVIGNEIHIKDSNNVNVKNVVFESKDNGKTNTLLIYAFVENFTNDYFLLVNGEKIVFEKNDLR